MIASKNPQNLCKFYASAIHGEIVQGINNTHFWVYQKASKLKIQIYRPSRSKPWPLIGKALAPCLQNKASKNPLITLENWTEELISYGAIAIENPNLESFGAEAWMKDPEGNYFLAYVPKN